MIDPAKISGITDWPTLTLTTFKEVRSTLGRLGYHRPWIPNFAKMRSPLQTYDRRDGSSRLEASTVRKPSED